MKREAVGSVPVKDTHVICAILYIMINAYTND